MKELEAGCLAVVISGPFIGKSVRCLARTEKYEHALVSTPTSSEVMGANHVLWITQLQNLDPEVYGMFSVEARGVKGDSVFEPHELLRIDDLPEDEKEREMDEIY